MQASEYYRFESLHERYLDAILRNDYERAEAVIRERDELLFEPLDADLAEIVFFFEHKHKISFKEIHRTDDGSYSARWSETDRKLENLRVNYINNWLHEKVAPLISDLPAAASRHGYTLEGLYQPRPGTFVYWVSSADGLEHYRKYKAF